MNDKELCQLHHNVLHFAELYRQAKSQAEQGGYSREQQHYDDLLKEAEADYAMALRKLHKELMDTD